jgi:hypothetical protein
MLTKDQAIVVADQLIANSERRREYNRIQRLERIAGRMPMELSVDEFEDSVHAAEKRLLRRPVWWIAIIVWSLLGLTLVFADSRALPAGYVLLGLLLGQMFKKRLIAADVHCWIRGMAANA